MAINALLPVVGASKGFTQRAIKATLVFSPTHDKNGPPVRVKPVHLYENAEPEVILALVDGIGAALNALAPQSGRPARRADLLRTGFCDNARLHTHQGADALLACSLPDPLESVFSLYAPIGAGVYHFGPTGILKARWAGHTDDEPLPAIRANYQRIFLSDGLTDRFLGIRQDACRTMIDDLYARRRMSIATRDRLAELLINAGRVSPSDPAFPSSRILWAQLAADDRMMRDAAIPAANGSMSADRAVVMDW